MTFTQSVPLVFRKPNKRVEVVQLSDVMDTMLERAGAENEDYVGPTKVPSHSQGNHWVGRVCVPGREARCGLECDSSTS